MPQLGPAKLFCVDALVHQTKRNRLVIQKIAPKSSGITRYNMDNYCTPLVEGDLIVAVNGKDKVDGILESFRKLLFSLLLKRPSHSFRCIRYCMFFHRTLHPTYIVLYISALEKTIREDNSRNITMGLSNLTIGIDSRKVVLPAYAPQNFRDLKRRKFQSSVILREKGFKI